MKKKTLEDLNNLTHTNLRMHLEPDKISNLEYIALYLAINGPTPRNVLRKALIAWRGKEPHYYTQYFWYLPESDSANYYNDLWSQEGGASFIRKRTEPQRMFLTIRGMTVALRAAKRLGWNVRSRLLNHLHSLKVEDICLKSAYPEGGNSCETH